jgi:TPR repeat protein
MYEEAMAVAQDNNEALTWYQLAGNHGFVAAQVRLGDIARFGELGQPRNEDVALRWYRMAAGQGNGSAEEKIGDLYWSGSLTITRDSVEAVRRYRIAAEQGIASAQRKLALAYANADGAPADDSQMLFWTRKAAENGDAEAAALLGDAIMVGLDGSYDYVEAATWLTLAVDKAHDAVWQPRAAAYLRTVQDALTPAERAACDARLNHWRALLEGEQQSVLADSGRLKPSDKHVIQNSSALN